MGAAKKAKHTPGPWTLNKSYRVPVVGYDVGDGGELLAIVDVVQGYSAKQAQANARLISIAPEMLDMLRRAGDAIEALDGTSVDNEKLVDDYRALMARVA